MPWEGINRFGERLSITLPGSAGVPKDRKAYARALKRRLAHDRAGDILELYVDGSSFVSKGCRKTGWSWVLFRNGREISSAGAALGPRATNYDGEAWALAMGLTHTLKLMHDFDDTRLHVLCDNTSLLQAISARDPKGSSAAVDVSRHALIDHLSTHPDTHINIVWVPSHEGVFGNERADRLAKKAARTTPAPLFNRSSDYIKHRAKAKLNRDWDAQWRQFKVKHPSSMATKALVFKPRLKLHPSHKDPGRRRHVHTQLIRAITGHGRHAAFLARIGSIDSAACPCGAPSQDVPHILTRCPRHRKGRRFLTAFSKSLNLGQIFSTAKGLKAALEFFASEKVDI